LEREHEQLITEYNEALQKLTAAQAAVTTAKAEQDFLVQRTSTALDFANSELSNLASRLAAAESSNTELLRSKDDLQKLFDQTISSIKDKFDTEHASWTKLVSDKDEEIQYYQQQLTSRQAEISQSRSAYQQLTSKNKQLQEDLLASSSAYSYLKTEYDKTVVQLRDISDKEDESLASITDTLIHNQTTIINLQQEHQVELQTTKETYEKQVQQLQASYATLEQQSALKDQNLKTLQTTIENKNRDLHLFETQLTEFTTAKTHKDQAISNLRNKLHNHDSDITTYKQTLEIKENQLRDYKQTLEIKDKQIRDYTTGIQNHNQIVTDLNINLHTKDLELKDLQHKLNTLWDTTQGKDTFIFNLQTQLKHQEEALRRRVQTHPSSSLEMVDFAPLISAIEGFLSKDEKKAIPFFSGSDSTINVTKWIRDAERTGKTNGWPETIWLTTFSSRLKGDAQDWHVEYIENPNRTTEEKEYKGWKKNLIKQFRTAADIEEYRLKLQQLKQREDQKVQSFIDRLNFLYDIVYGTFDNTQTGSAKDTLKSMRDKEKCKLLLGGLLPKIADEVWPRLSEDDSFDAAVKIVLTAEKVATTKEISKQKGVTAIAQNISQISKTNLDSKLESLITSLEKLKPTLDSLQPGHSVATAEQWRPSSRRFSRDRNDYSRSSSGRSYDRQRRRSFTNDRYDNYNRGRSNSRGRSVSFVDNRSRSHSPQRSRSRDRHPTWPKTGTENSDKNHSGIQSRSPTPEARHRGANKESFTEDEYEKKRNRRCHRCERRGHIARECRVDVSKLPSREGRSRRNN